MAKMGRCMVQFVKENPKVHKEDIIAMIDKNFLNEQKKVDKKTQMRRTYDIMNALITAEVFIEQDKYFWYNPLVLEGEHAAAESAKKIEIKT